MSAFERLSHPPMCPNATIPSTESSYLSAGGPPISIAPPLVLQHTAMKQQRAALVLLSLAALALHGAVGCAFILRRPGSLNRRRRLGQQRVPVGPSRASTALRMASEMGPEDKESVVRRRRDAIRPGACV